MFCSNFDIFWSWSCFSVQLSEKCGRWGKGLIMNSWLSRLCKARGICRQSLVKTLYKHQLHPSMLYRLLIGVIRLTLSWERIANRLYIPGYDLLPYSEILIKIDTYPIFGHFWLRLLLIYLTKQQPFVVGQNIPSTKYYLVHTNQYLTGQNWWQI